MFKENLKKLRTSRGLSQVDLAEAIGVVQGTIYFWENGKTEPTGNYLIGLAKFFGVTIDELMGVAPLAANADLLELNSIIRGMSEENKKLCLELIKAVAKSRI